MRVPVVKAWNLLYKSPHLTWVFTLCSQLHELFLICIHWVQPCRDSPQPSRKWWLWSWGCLTFAGPKIIQLQLVSLFGPLQSALSSEEMTGARIGLVVGATSLGKTSESQSRWSWCSLENAVPEPSGASHTQSCASNGVGSVTRWKLHFSTQA